MVDPLAPEAEAYAKELIDGRAQCIEAINTAEEATPALEEHMEHGTAGFRGHNSIMPRVALRAALLIAMRAKSTGTCGIMVTASHNHHEDNGVKIIDFEGKPLLGDWELIAEMLINSVDIIWSIKNLNQLTIKGFPTDANLFGV